MTAAETQRIIGQEGDFPVGDTVFRIAVKDVKHAFGRIDLLIYPLAGRGEKWVSKDSVTLDCDRKPAAKPATPSKWSKANA